jgi:hypothetical protein
MTSRFVRLTARNCAFLRAQKCLWNKPTYARLLAAVNAGGEEAGRAYLQQRAEMEAACRAGLQPEPTGYRPCACRDCMETAIGEPGAMCHSCEDAGCEGERECLAAGAYGGEVEL